MGLASCKKSGGLFSSTALDEQQRRLFAGIESLRLGRGGDRQLGEFLGPGPAYGRPRPTAATRSGHRARPLTPTRRRPKSRWTPQIVTVIERLLEHDTAGDPITGLKWSRRTIDKIAECLREKRLWSHPLR